MTRREESDIDLSQLLSGSGPAEGYDLDDAVEMLFDALAEIRSVQRDEAFAPEASITAAASLTHTSLQAIEAHRERMDDGGDR